MAERETLSFTGEIGTSCKAFTDERVFLPPWMTKTPKLDHEVKKRKLVDQVHDLVLTMNPLWMTKPEETTNQEYDDFFKCLTGNRWKEHLAVKHFSVEGYPTFKAILFVPKRTASPVVDDLSNDDSSESEEPGKIKLFTGTVVVTSYYPELLPRYLSFVEGIVDIVDLPLYTPCEVLEQKGYFEFVRHTLENKCLELLFEIAENKELYDTFYEDFSWVLKEGITEASDKGKIAELLRYRSTQSVDVLTSFKDYVTRMKDGQKDIYYITGCTMKAVKNSPLLEKLNKIGYEVLYVVGGDDEYLIPMLKEFEGKRLVPVNKEGLQLEEESSDHEEVETKEFEGLCKVIKDILGDKVVKVIVSDRLLVDSPCCLVTGEYGWTGSKGRILKEQAWLNWGEVLNISMEKTMEINPQNPIMVEIRKRADDEDKLYVKELVMLLFETALLSCGFVIDHHPRYTSRDRINRMLELGWNSVLSMEMSNADMEKAG